VSATQGFVYLVGAGPGDPGLITVRGIERLKQADVVVYDRLANHSLLAHARNARLIDVGKRPNHHKVSQDEITALLVELAQAGNVVVRLKGGDPFVFGRGGEEALALAQAGIPFEIVPGITSVIAAPAYAGIPVTHRNVACSVTFATGHRADYVKDSDCDWGQLASSADTLIFLMGVHNLPTIVSQLVSRGRSPDTPIALVERASRTSQKTVTGTLANIVERAAAIRPPAAIIIGEVVKLRESLGWFDRPDRHPLLGLRVLNTRPLDQAGSLSRRLMDLGAEAVELPTTQIVPADDSGPLDEAIRRLAPSHGARPYWDWVLFTSTNSVTYFMDRVLALGFDSRALAGVNLFVAGQATVSTLQQYGLKPDFIPTRYTGRDMAEEIGEIGWQRMLMPAAAGAAPDVVRQALAGKGALIETVTAYAVKPVAPDPVTMAVLLDGGVDVVTFVSPSAVSGLAHMLQEQHLPEAVSNVRAVCMGPATAQTARDAGMQVDEVADDHTINGLLNALQRWHQQHRHELGQNRLWAELEAVSDS
jgi:uroporphyrinogen III methyltransferase/synthase